jgi:hypothetical protein
MMSSEMTTKPFTWCLPRHLFAVRKMTFLIGIAICILATVPVTRQPDAHAWRLICTLGSLFGASAIAYLSGVKAVLFVPKRDRIWAVWPSLLAWMILLVGAILAKLSRLESLVFGHPALMVLAGSLIGLGLWIQMGRRGWGRQFCTSGWCFSPSVQREAYARWARRRAGAKHAEFILESFFLDRMKAGAPHYGARFIWGTLYTTWGHLALWWKFLVIPLILVTIIAEYAGEGAGWVFAWVSLVVVPFPWLPFRSVLLLPAGRREKFVAALSLGVATAGVVMLFIVILAMFSVPLAALIPGIEVWGFSLTCHRIPLTIAWVPLLVVPLIATPRVVCARTSFPVDLLIVVMVPVAFAIVGMVLLIILPVFWTSG